MSIEKKPFTVSDIEAMIGEAVRRSKPDDRDTAAEMIDTEIDHEDPESVDRWEAQWARAYHRAAKKLIGAERRKLNKFAAMYPELREAILDATRELDNRWIHHEKKEKTHA